jgi:hypothetical protein
MRTPTLQTLAILQKAFMAILLLCRVGNISLWWKMQAKRLGNASIIFTV